MLQVEKALLVMFVLLLAACGPATQSGPDTHVPVLTATALPTVTPIPQNTATTTIPDSPTPTPTDTPVSATATPTLDPISATIAAQMGSLGALTQISQYLDPVGAPLKAWNNVPVMPQATAGQEFTPNIYSYTAEATLAQAQQFYQANAGKLGLTFTQASGSSGAGSLASHNFTFVSFDLSIVITSYDNDPGHAIVVISKVAE